MKLRFYFNSEGNKIYTLDEEKNGKETQNAHYKFVKIRDVTRDNPKTRDFFKRRKN